MSDNVNTSDLPPRRAVREDWPLSPELRKMIVTQMALVVGRSEDEKCRIAAAKLLLEADALNAKREAMDQDDAHKALPNVHLHAYAALETLRQDAMHDPEYLEYLRRRALEADRDAGLVRALGERREVATSSPLAPSRPSSDRHDRWDGRNPPPAGDDAS